MWTSFYPVLMVDEPVRAADFYRRHFGFETTFEADWYVSLRRGDHELALLDPGHGTVPPGYGTLSAGVLLNVEVDDVDDEYRRLVVEAGLPPVLDIRSEAFGQRHFILAGPGRVLIDVISPIEPDESHAEQYR
ncbi:VOC family protein [Kocuria himachalensis]